MAFWRDNGLTIALAIATATSIGAMFVTGWSAFNHNALLHHEASSSMLEYSTSGHFLSAMFENWESEFLQMFTYVCLTAFLFQRGSAESKDPDSLEENMSDPPFLATRAAAFVYSYSLGIALALLFLASFGLHLVFSAEAARLEADQHGTFSSSLYQHLGDAEFWFESLQNWQSEFLSTMVLVVLTIFLRFRGSPESKPVSAPNSQTGTG